MSGKNDSWVWDPGHEGFRGLARFVSPAAVQGLNLVIPDAYERLNQGLDVLSGDELTAKRAENAQQLLTELYQRLKNHAYPYNVAPWHPDGSKQRIRDPQEIHRSSATCLDIALMFASVCLANGLRPYIVLTSALDSEPHALVMVDLLRGTDRGRRTPPVVYVGPDDSFQRDASQEEGVWHYDRHTLAEGHLKPHQHAVMLDIVQATKQFKGTFARAVATASDGIAQNLISVSILDIVLIQIGGPGSSSVHEAVLPVDANRPAIYMRLPPRPTFIEYKSRQNIVETLSTASGIAAIIGPQGSGKSMLAHYVAQHADDGAGWFLDASSPQALQASLAMAEASEQGVRAESLTTADLTPYLKLALNRLAEKDGPWVVIIDNANGNPESFSGLIPKPRSQAGQFVLITTTNHRWAQQCDKTVAVPPLHDGEVTVRLGSDISQSVLAGIAGRPLLLQASLQFRKATDRWWWLASHLAAEKAANDAPFAYWRAASEEFADNSIFQLAECIAWLPPVHIPLQLLSDVLQADIRKVRRLAVFIQDIGLIDLFEEGVAMHGLFRRAVLEDAMRRDRRRQARQLLEILRHPLGQNLLERSADRESAKVMHDLFADSDDIEARMTGLHALGIITERYDVGMAAGWYAEVLDAIYSSNSYSERRPWAVAIAIDSLRGRARRIIRDADYHRFAEAAAWLLDAEQLAVGIDSDEVNLARSRAGALLGILYREQAWQVAGDIAKIMAAEPMDSVKVSELRQEELRLLQAAAQFLRRSYQERRRAPGSDDPTDVLPLNTETPDVDRSLYNIAGLSIRLAQVDSKESVAAYLAEADSIYTRVLDVRLRRYKTKELDEIACCYMGLALVAYYRSMFLQLGPEASTRQLRSAMIHIHESLSIRQRLAGPLENETTARTANVAAKIMLALLHVAGGFSRSREEEAIAEFYRERSLHALFAWYHRT